MSPDPFFLDDEIDSGPPPPELPPDEPAFEAFERFGQLLLRKRELKRELAQIEKELTHLMPFLLQFFENHPAWPKVSVYNLSIFPKDFLYLRPQEHASKQDLCDALRASGWGHFIRDDYSTRTLGTHIRDLEADHLEELETGLIPDTYALLPPLVAAVLNLEPTTKIVGMRQQSPKKPKENHRARKPTLNHNE